MGCGACGLSSQVLLVSLRYVGTHQLRSLSVACCWKRPTKLRAARMVRLYLNTMGQTDT